MISATKQWRKYFWNKWIRLPLAAVSLGIVFCSGAVHPYGPVRISPVSHSLLKGARIDPPAFDALRRSCQDCHSENTAWPWYSYVAPISWLIENDVRKGRDQFDMSHWDEYSWEEQHEILSQLSAMVNEKKMPLAQYLLLHSRAKLSDADIQNLKNWTLTERSRLEAQHVRVSR